MKDQLWFRFRKAEQMEAKKLIVEIYWMFVQFIMSFKNCATT